MAEAYGNLNLHMCFLSLKIRILFLCPQYLVFLGFIFLFEVILNCLVWVRVNEEKAFNCGLCIKKHRGSVSFCCRREILYHWAPLCVERNLYLWLDLFRFSDFICKVEWKKWFENYVYIFDTRFKLNCILYYKNKHFLHQYPQFNIEKTPYRVGVDLIKWKP